MTRARRRTTPRVRAPAPHTPAPQINIDEGWLKSRNSSGWIVEDFVKFPEGMDGFGACTTDSAPVDTRHPSVGLCSPLRARAADCAAPPHPTAAPFAAGAWVHSQELSPGSGQYFKYGLYSCRGTCQCR
jgi:hypothetical protein